MIHILNSVYLFSPCFSADQDIFDSQRHLFFLNYDHKLTTTDWEPLN